MTFDEMTAAVSAKLVATFERRDRDLSSERNKKNSHAVKAGASGSSRALLMIVDLFKSEISDRAGIVSEQLRETSRAVGLQPIPDLEAQLRGYVETTMDAQHASLRANMVGNPPFKGTTLQNQSMIAQTTSQFDEVSKTARDGVLADMALLASEIQSAASNKVGRGDMHVNINAPVGILQTGDFASASQSITVTPDAAAEVVRALEVLEIAVSALTETAINRDELKAIIGECKAELAKDAPNKTRLSALLYGVAGTVQTTAALKPAYETFRTALSAIGIPLP
ncbi:MAG: hypothetical protein COW30_13995 [Rhodospirillales bacterium CG15_BIG_FIL_POST_REV_8_21_14_020_66_15]|nr:MAG: hypothetical protein COW30_13995 [Rhodospirillales bacterium CG15_BIG_FIL_POST_REV_8_21_14_020_66_15]